MLFPGFALFIVIVICVTAWAIHLTNRAAKCSAARSEAIRAQVHDNNRKERKEWIATNCELAAQLEDLRGLVKDLTCENDRNRDFMAKFNLSDIKLLSENIEEVKRILQEIRNNARK